MKTAVVPSNYAASVEEGRCSAEILILPDGRILAHNITPAVAAVLAEQGDGDPVIMGPWVGQVVGGAPEVVSPANAKTAPYTYPTPPWAQRT